MKDGDISKVRKETYMITTKNNRSVPIKVNAFEHQIRAFNFAIDKFGVDKGCDALSRQVLHRGVALLAEM